MCNSDQGDTTAMERIWAPWRIQYILEGYKGECLFCDVQRENYEGKHFILEQKDNCLVMFNLFPYNNGHLMVAPQRHVSDLDCLTDEELLCTSRLVRKWTAILKKEMKPEGFNIGLNIGKVAGAGFAGHLHYHIVPRWNGDTNFMPVTAGTKILSESLESCYDRLARALEQYTEGGGGLK